MKQQTICSEFLTRLGVPHTSCFTDERFKNSPFGETLKGFQDLLDEYDVASELRRYDDKTKIDGTTVPFIAMMLGRLVVVTSVTDSAVTIIRDGKETTVDRDNFLKQWNGKALFAFPDKESGEPSIKNHRRLQTMMLVRRWGISVCLAVIFIWLFIAGGLYRNVGTILVALFDMAAIYVCYLLLRKQLHISGGAADAMCGFLQKGGCGSIMERKVSKIFGVIGWGEVGMAYFSVSLIALVCYPPCLGYLAFFNACCLPYTVWSISYQKFVAKIWCTLCVTVQTLQWLLFGSYLLADAWHGLWPLHPSLFILGFGYLLALLLVDRLLPVVSKALEHDEITARYDNLRLRSDVFALEQQQQPQTAPMEDATTIIFGNPSAKPGVVVFSDPTSDKGASIHRQVDSLLKKGLSVGYVFLNNSDERKTAASKIIALYRKRGDKIAWEALKEWFGTGAKQPDFFSRYGVDGKEEGVADEIARQLKWQQDSYLYAAPTIIAAGHLLNDIYTLPDLVYIY